MRINFDQTFPVMSLEFVTKHKFAKKGDSSYMKCNFEMNCLKNKTSRSAASRLALTQKSPVSRLAVDLKVSCQPATITSNNILY